MNVINLSPANDPYSLRLSEIISTAHVFIDNGFGVIPIVARDKKPVSANLTSNSPLLTKEDATRVLTLQGPTKNLGVVPLSHLIVDIDVDSSRGKDGFSSFEKLQAKIGELPRTLTVRTGRGGLHLYFRLPGDIRGSLAGSLSSEYPAIDFKSTGHVVAPPSIHENGSQYRFEPSLGFSEIGIAEVPEPLLDLLRVRPQASKKTKRPTKSELASPGVLASPKADMTIVASACAYISEEIKKPHIDEPNWYAIAGIAAHTENGREWFHEISSPDPCYDEAETDAKLDQAHDAFGPRTCEYIANKLGCNSCSTCPFRNKITSPIQLGREDRDLVLTLKKTVVDTSSPGFIDIETNRRMSEKSFDYEYRHLLSAPSRDVTSSPLALKAQHIDYLPGASTIFNDDNGELVYNLYRAGPIVAREGAHPIIDAHLEYLFPDLVERDHILDVLAHLVQKPSIKIQQVILLIGRQGTGKSAIGRLISNLVGQKNCRSMSSEILKSNFQANLTNVQVLIIEELMNFDQLDASNKLKTFITEEFTDVEEKNVARHHARTPRLIVAFSNHELPIRVEESDRRYFVSNSDAPPKEQGYYEGLFRAIEFTEVSEFLFTLQSRDISSFSPTRRPPMTKAKQGLIADSRPEVDQIIQRLLAEGGSCLDNEIFLSDELARVLQQKLGRSVREKDKRQAIKALRAVRISQIRWLGAKPRPYAHRNTERWLAASAEEIRAELERYRVFAVG